MARAGKFYLGLVTAVIFILLEIAAISLLKRSSTLQNIWINRISHNVMATSWGGLTKVRNYFGLREQNEILAGRNYELFKELQHYKELEKTMNAMARLDSASLPSRFNYIPAEITAMGTNSRHNYIIRPQFRPGHSQGHSPAPYRGRRGYGPHQRHLGGVSARHPHRRHHRLAPH